MSSVDDFQRYVKCIIETYCLCLCDVLVFKLLNYTVTEEQTVCRKSVVLIEKCGRHVTSETGVNTSELVQELLQQSAVERLTTFRHLCRRNFGSISMIVTTDFEALYGYKRGDYDQCLRLSTENAKVLVQRKYLDDISTFSEFIQLFDDDIVSLKALTLIVKPKPTNSHDTSISQLTVSLYLMTQCQLKLRHSLTSLSRTLDYIEFVQRNMPDTRTLEYLTLNLASRKIVMYTKSILQNH